LPNFAAGDFWVLAAGPSADNYEWAVISAGQPDTKGKDGGCYSKAGLWIFTRDPTAQNGYANLQALELLRTKGVSQDKLMDVAQRGCTYEGMKRK